MHYKHLTEVNLTCCQILLELETKKAQSIQTKQQLPCAYHGIADFKDFFVKITHLFSHHCLQALFLLTCNEWNNKIFNFVSRTKVLLVGTKLSIFHISVSDRYENRSLLETFKRCLYASWTCYKWELTMLCKITGGGGGTPLYKQYRYVPPHRVGFLRRLGLEIKSNHCVKCLTTYVQCK